MVFIMPLGIAGDVPLGSRTFVGCVVSDFASPVSFATARYMLRNTRKQVHILFMAARREGAWTFLTNHAHVLVCVANDKHARIRDIAERVGITERGVQRVLKELEEAGYISHERDGRRNVYRVNRRYPLRHPLEQHRTVGALIALVEQK